MADDKQKNADFIGRVVSDPKNPQETRMLTGWFGESGEEGYRRLYTDAELNNYVDIPDDAILYSEPLKDVQPSGGVMVWIKRDAALKPGGSASSRAARFLQGQVQQDFASAGAAGSLEKAGLRCATEVPCGEPTGFTGQCTKQPEVGGAWPCITAIPHCFEVTGFTGKCTHAPWPNPTRYFGCTQLHCPTNDLTHIPHICNIVASGQPGCVVVNPPQGGDPAQKVAAGEVDEKEAPATSIPGCGYTRSWGVCETHLLGCGAAAQDNAQAAYITVGCPPTAFCHVSQNNCGDAAAAGVYTAAGCTRMRPVCYPTEVCHYTQPPQCVQGGGGGQQQAFAARAAAPRPAPVSQVGCPASDFVACSQFGGCPTLPKGDCTFFNCPSLPQQFAAAGAGGGCTQSGPLCHTYPRGDCTFFGCPSPGIDCTVVVCTHIGPQCPPHPSLQGQLCPITVGSPQCPPPQSLQGQLCPITTGGPQCPPVSGGFQCPSALCQSIACQSIACQPGGGGQQEFAARAAAGGGGGIGVTAWLDCTQFGAYCPPFFTQFEQQCVVQPIFTFDPQCLTPPPPTPACPTAHCPPHSHQFVVCTAFGPQCHRTVVEARAAQPAGGIHPTPATHCFVCDRQAAAAVPHTQIIVQCNPSLIDACPTRLIVQCNPSVIDACPTRLCTQQPIQCYPSVIDACPTRIGCPTQNPLQCPPQSGFNCPSQLGCQSIACGQSVACQPGGGGQQEAFAARAAAGGGGGIGVTAWLDCTQFGAYCPPFFTQFEQQCVVQPIFTFDPQCPTPPPPTPACPTFHCPPKSHLFVFCTAFGPQCPRTVVEARAAQQAGGGGQQAFGAVVHPYTPMHQCFSPLFNCPTTPCTGVQCFHTSIGCIQ